MWVGFVLLLAGCGAGMVAAASGDAVTGVGSRPRCSWRLVCLLAKPLTVVLCRFPSLVK